MYVALVMKESTTKKTRKNKRNCNKYKHSCCLEQQIWQLDALILFKLEVSALPMSPGCVCRCISTAQSDVLKSDSNIHSLSDLIV